jgi:hypothetical protein
LHTKEEPARKVAGLGPLAAFLFDTNISVQYHLEKKISSPIRNNGGNS